MTGMTTELTLEQAVDYTIDFCIQTHGHAPDYLELGPRELQCFEREIGYPKKEYRGVPIRQMNQAGVTFKLRHWNLF